jgi:ribosomal protein L35AE/L33A
MEILLYKKTTDADLQIGQKICYKDQNGFYSKLGIITDWYFSQGVLNFLINTSFGSYTADELKLIKN